MHSITKPTKLAEHSAPPLLFPFLDLKAEYALMKEEIRAAVDKVLESQQFIMGPPVRELEAEVAALVGCRFALGCASGSDALLLALMALGVGSGDEVITSPFTFVATAGSISRLMAKPVLSTLIPKPTAWMRSNLKPPSPAEPRRLSRFIFSDCQLRWKPSPRSRAHIECQ
jgi:histidinol-phosphate/aromatic aminotransferase/cobyric acid decarboxylase-like protein